MYLQPKTRRRIRRGQALSEFVVAVPVFIVMLFFAWYFSDLVQVRLDTQEMARLTGMGANEPNDARFCRWEPSLETA